MWRTLALVLTLAFVIAHIVLRSVGDPRKRRRRTWYVAGGLAVLAALAAALVVRAPTSATAAPAFADFDVFDDPGLSPGMTT